MNAKRILCPIDFSDNSDAAMNFAASLAADPDATLLLLHVNESYMAYDAGFAAYAPPTVDPAILAERLEGKRPVGTRGKVERYVRSGHPAEVIVSFAEEQDVDLIVMGTHGRKGLSRLLMGSIAESVLRHAACPVVTLKVPVEETADRPLTNAT